MDSIEAALKDLALQDKPNISLTARQFNVNRSTLSRRFNGVTSSQQDKTQNQQLLAPQQEHTLVKHIQKLTEYGLLPTPVMIRNLAKEIAGQEPSNKWPARFLKRWSHELDSKYLAAIDIMRSKADSEASYKVYFQLLKEKLEIYKVEPHNWYNMDEKGFSIGLINKSKRIFSKALYQSGRVLGHNQDGNREWITIVAAVCADNTWLPPGIIYKGQSSNIQDSWVQDLEEGLQEVFMASSPTGWTNEDLGFQWLTAVFDRHTKSKPRNGRDWRLLFLDGHGSHINMRFIEWCIKHKILLAVYPPHSTHRLQPLDVSVFSPLSAYYSQELDQFIFDSQGLSAISKRDFLQLFWPAFLKSFTKDNISSGWLTTGLYPFNPEAVLTKVKVQDRPTSKDSSTSTNSVLSAGDWRKIRTLLKDVFSDVVEPQVNKVNKIENSLLHITAQYSILKAENEGFKRAIVNEKKRRKRGKQLFEQLRAEDNNGATWFSPNKLLQAKALQQQRELEKEDHQAQKQLHLEAQKQHKQLKEVEALQKQQQRQQQQQERTAQALQKQALKQQQKDSKTADQQLQNSLQASVKKPKKRSTAVKKLQQLDLVQQPDFEQKQPDQVISTRSRIVRPPKRFEDFEIYQ